MSSLPWEEEFSLDSPPATLTFQFIIQGFCHRNRILVDLQHGVKLIIDFLDTGEVCIGQINRGELPLVKSRNNLIKGDVE